MDSSQMIGIFVNEFASIIIPIYFSNSLLVWCTLHPKIYVMTCLSWMIEVG